MKRMESNILSQHPELSMRKDKIFQPTDIEKRKTKIVCTLGYSQFYNF